MILHIVHLLAKRTQICGLRWLPSLFKAIGQSDLQFLLGRFPVETIALGWKHGAWRSVLVASYAIMHGCHVKVVQHALALSLGQSWHGVNAVATTNISLYGSLFVAKLSKPILAIAAYLVHRFTQCFPEVLFRFLGNGNLFVSRTFKSNLLTFIKKLFL